MSTREQCYQALFALLQTLDANDTFATVDRKLRYLEEVNGPDLPALYMVGGPEMVTQRHGLPPKRRLSIDVFVYAASPNPNSTADAQLNDLIDAIEACVAPAPCFAAQTLGGVVEHCWIEGTVPRYSAPKGQRAGAIVPFHIMMP